MSFPPSRQMTLFIQMPVWVRYPIALIFSAITVSGCKPVTQARGDEPLMRPSSLALAEAMASVDGAPPAYALVIVDLDDGTLIHTEGLANVETGRPVNSDSTFYIASVTKSFVGLMAARLHEEGQIDLTAPISTYLPDLELPSPLNPDDITSIDLLSHTSQIENDVLIQLTAYSGAPTDDVFYDVLREDTLPLEDPFTYANEGYVLYSQIMKEALGLSWQDGLQSLILDPLGMTETYTRTSLIPDHQKVAGHVRTENGWVIVPPKTDDIMHAAGGLYISAEDAARWIETTLNPLLASSTGISQSAHELALIPHADQDRRFINFQRDSYALGWNISRYNDVIVYEHGGGYTGHQSYFAVLPEAGLGVAVMTNSNLSGLPFAVLMSEHVIDESLGREDLEDAADQRLNQFERIVSSRFDSIAAAREEALNSSAWSPADLSDFAGTYTHPRLGVLQVNDRDGYLEASLGAEALVFYPGSVENAFLLETTPFAVPDESVFFIPDNAAPGGNDQFILYEMSFDRVE